MKAMPKSLKDVRSELRRKSMMDHNWVFALDTYPKRLKVGWGKPTQGTPIMNSYSQEFYEDMYDRLSLENLVQRAAREYLLMGNAYLYSVEHLVEESLGHKADIIRRSSVEEALKLSENGICDLDVYYKGWEKVLVLPPDQVRVLPLPNTEEIDYHINSAALRKLKKDASVRYIAEEFVGKGGWVQLHTKPDSGSHVCHLSYRSFSQYEALGTSAIEHAEKRAKKKVLSFEDSLEMILRGFAHDIEDFIVHNLLDPVSKKKGFVNSAGAYIQPVVHVTVRKVP